jgi:inosine-uridine nucleoside N-ribohydrolase
MMAMLTPELKIEAITSAVGNIPLAVTTENALRLVTLCGRTDIPVAAGAKEPLVRRLQIAANIHGDNGLAGVELPPATIKPVADSAAERIAKVIRANPGQLTILALAPLTNIALALRSDPSLASQVESMVLMGGSLSRGNVTPVAEFNFYVDPEAAAIVFESGIPIIMVGLDVTERVTFTDTHLKQLRTGNSAVSRAAAEIASHVLDSAEKRTHKREFHMHDALALAYLLDPQILTLEDDYIRIETSGEFTAGESIAYRKTPMRISAPLLGQETQPASSAEFRPNARVGVDVRSERFFQLMMERLAR